MVSKDMNYKTPEVQVYRKVLCALKMKQVEGTTKTILVKQGLVDKTMNRYCLLKVIASQVIQDIHLSHMHIGIDGIVQQAKNFIWMPG